MPTFIHFFNLTQKGIENVKKGPERVSAAKRAFQALGAEIKAFFLVFGQYDAVVISEAASEEIIARALLSLNSLGYVRSATMRAFTEDEYRQLIAALP
jgi:uncharacterized protein with GYD domain